MYIGVFEISDIVLVLVSVVILLAIVAIWLGLKLYGSIILETLRYAITRHPDWPAIWLTAIYEGKIMVVPRGGEVANPLFSIRVPGRKVSWRGLQGRKLSLSIPPATEINIDFDPQKPDETIKQFFYRLKLNLPDVYPK